MSDKPIIYVIDDQEVIRHSAGLLLRDAGFEVLAYASGGEFLDAFDATMPSCILLAIRMPVLDGLDVQRILVERGIVHPIILLTGHGDIPHSVRAMKSGAVDFLEKPFERVALLSAIEEAFGRLATARTHKREANGAATRLAALTPREREVLVGMAAGHPNKIIAHTLGISMRTVEAHRANLMHKLGVRSISDVLRLAFAAELGPASDG